jgi:hypothetical protein
VSLLWAFVVVGQLIRAIAWILLSVAVSGAGAVHRPPTVTRPLAGVDLDAPMLVVVAAAEVHAVVAPAATECVRMVNAAVSTAGAVQATPTAAAMEVEAAVEVGKPCTADLAVARTTMMSPAEHATGRRSLKTKDIPSARRTMRPIGKRCNSMVQTTLWPLIATF